MLKDIFKSLENLFFGLSCSLLIYIVAFFVTVFTKLTKNIMLLLIVCLQGGM